MPQPARREKTAAKRAGLVYVSDATPGIRRVLFRALLFGLSASAVPALMPVVARDLVAGGPLTYGVLLGAFGVGAVGGALLVRRLRAREAGDDRPVDLAGDRAPDDVDQADDAAALAAGFGGRSGGRRCSGRRGGRGPAPPRRRCGADTPAASPRPGAARC